MTTIYQIRRLCWLWGPIIAAGSLLMLTGVAHSRTVNGATLAGFLTALAGLIALACDADTRKHTP